MIEDCVDAIDLNFGCPQGIAKRGNYGSFLLSSPDLIVSLISHLHQNLKVPVTAKIRILPDEAQTIQLVKRIELAGASLITVHGRTKEQKQ
jgi:tRNA-dihydrouridine synthase 1